MANGWDREGSLLDAVDALVVALDREGRIVAFNRAAERLSGYTREEVRERDIVDLLVADEEADAVRKAFASAFDGECSGAFEIHWKCRSGDLRLISWTATFVPGADDEARVLVATGIDVTEQRRLERDSAAARATVRESRSLLQLVLDSIPVRVFWKDRDLNYLGCNRTAAIDAGLSSTGEIVGKNDFDLRWSREAELYRADDRLVIESGQPKINYEEPQTDPDGNERWLRTSKVPLKDSAGRIIGVMGCYEDITAPRRMEEALRVSEARLLAAYRNFPFEFWLCDRDGRCVMQNELSKAHWGDQIGRRPYEIEVPAAVKKLWLASTGRAFRGEVVQGEVTLEVEGENQSYHSILAPIRTAGGIQGILGFNFDITDRKRAEEILLRQHEIVQTELAKARDALVRSTRLATIGQVAASIAHELRNPLGAIRNASYYLSRRLADDDPHWREYLDLIDAEVAGSDRIISDLLDMTRSKDPKREPVDLGAAARGAFSRVRGSSGAVLCVDLDVEPFMLSADPAQLRQVFLNLMNNSIQSCPGKARITLGANRLAGWAVITFSDNGPGVPEEQRELIFEPLYSTRAKGTGLGLSICRQICENHGGKIDAVTPKDGTGAAFRIRLPYPAS